MAVLAVSCLGTASREWGAAIARSERAQALEALPPEAQRSLLPLSEIFYERIVSRRFNSRATFEDPSMRQFFPTLAAYSDYYAALADALDRAYIEYNRPTEVTLLRVERVEDRTVRLDLKFVGENDLPLRWWNASLRRSDLWRWEENRWWIVPGKV
jgi:hypothetical protein